MSRFQATVDHPTELELEYLRETLGLRDDQKANLLREVARLASWCVRQVSAGKHIVAQDTPNPEDGEELADPVLDRLRATRPERLVLTHEEAERLAQLLDAPPTPSPALVRALNNIAAKDRQPPSVRWSE